MTIKKGIGARSLFSSIIFVSFDFLGGSHEIYDALNLCWDDPDVGGGLNWTRLSSIEALLQQYVTMK